MARNFNSNPEKTPQQLPSSGGTTYVYMWSDEGDPATQDLKMKYDDLKVEFRKQEKDKLVFNTNLVTVLSLPYFGPFNSIKLLFDNSQITEVKFTAKDASATSYDLSVLDFSTTDGQAFSNAGSGGTIESFLQGKGQVNWDLQLSVVPAASWTGKMYVTLILE